MHFVLFLGSCKTNEGVNNTARAGLEQGSIEQNRSYEEIVWDAHFYHLFP